MKIALLVVVSVAFALYVTFKSILNHEPYRPNDADRYK